MIRSRYFSFVLAILFLLLLLSYGQNLTQAQSAWNCNNAYSAGALVTYNGSTYKALVAVPAGECGWIPGSTPTVWGLQSGGSSTNTPTFVPAATKTPTPGPTSTGGFVVSSTQFANWFPGRLGFYTYANFITAKAAYPSFASSGNSTVDKQEAAAFFAHVAHETSGLIYIDEQNYTPGYYCSYAGNAAQYGCASGADYHGRGPLQLSWNYNYKTASNGQYYNGSTWTTLPNNTVGADIWSNPNLVATDGVITWKTALWFWMTHGYDWGPPNKPTPHMDMISGGAGFGATINSINGGLECAQPSGSNGYNEMQDRVSKYNTFLSNLGVSDSRTKTC